MHGHRKDNCCTETLVNDASLRNNHLAAAMIDVDFFKLYNDRYSGEKFLLICPHFNANQIEARL